MKITLILKSLPHSLKCLKMQWQTRRPEWQLLFFWVLILLERTQMWDPHPGKRYREESGSCSQIGCWWLFFVCRLCVIAKFAWRMAFCTDLPTRYTTSVVAGGKVEIMKKEMQYRASDQCSEGSGTPASVCWAQARTRVCPPQEGLCLLYSPWQCPSQRHIIIYHTRETVHPICCSRILCS